MVIYHYGSQLFQIIYINNQITRYWQNDIRIICESLILMLRILLQAFPDESGATYVDYASDGEEISDLETDSDDEPTV